MINIVGYKPGKFFMKYVSLAVLLLWAATASAQDGKAPAKKDLFNVNKKTVAIYGWDVGSYFDAEPARGKASFSSEYDGVTYFFSSEANQKRFTADPAKYEPVYGGWCAYAMGDTGKKVDINPKTYKILDGKLYLFYNKFFNNTLDDWNEDEANLKAKADKNWMNLEKGLPPAGK